VAARFSQRGGKLRAAIKGVGTLAAFCFNELGDHLEAFGLNEPGDGFALGFESRPAQLAGVDAKIANQRLCHGGSPFKMRGCKQAENDRPQP
jgi:hypothetical protein